MSERRDPLDNSGGYVGGTYTHGPSLVPWGVQAPATGEDRPAEQRAARELELDTTAGDDRGVGPLTAAPTALCLAAISVAALWLLGGLVGFVAASVAGVLAIIYGLRARRSARYSRNRAWWLGTASVALVVVSMVGCLTYNVLLPDKSRGGASCVSTATCPSGTGA